MIPPALMDRWQRTGLKRQRRGYLPPRKAKLDFIDSLNPSKKDQVPGRQHPWGLDVESMDRQMRAAMGGGISQQPLTSGYLQTIDPYQPTEPGWITIYGSDSSGTTTDATNASITVPYTWADANTVTIGTTSSIGNITVPSGSSFHISAVDVSDETWINGDVLTQPGDPMPTGIQPFTHIQWDEKAWRREQHRQKLRAQITGGEHRNHRGALARANHKPADFTHVTQPEMVALQLMKSMLSKEDWKRYLRYGFVVIHGASGLYYQVVRNQDHVRVYRRGKKIAELCIYVPGVPPTDQVVAKKIMLECSEMDVWHKANIRQHRAWTARYRPTEEELVKLAA